MKKVIFVLIVVIILALGWKLGSPLFIDETVDEELPEEFNSVEEMDLESMSQEERMEMEKKMLEDADMEDVMVEEKMDEQMDTAQVAKEGDFKDADNFHKGSGEAKILTSSSWSILRLEDFNVTNGPALVVLLSTNANPTTSDDLGEYVKLGSLKGNMGNQNYDIPANVDISKYNSVVIYCEPFHVVFSVASLR